MQPADYVTLSICLLGISAYGFVKARRKENEKQSAQESMIGSGVSVWSVTLSVCSGFISSISLLGFPAEVYFQGAMILWYIPMYFISFPIVAYIFLPVLYNLKLTTIYEYFEKRFNYECRIATTLIFCIQMTLYNSVALYAPSLAIASITHIPIMFSILITASLSAIYISIGGAKAGIHTSAIQMALIFFTLSFVIMISLNETTVSDVYKNVIDGKRLILNDFRLNPTIRHSVWSLIIGGTGNILTLFAANQLSIQRYLVMDSLKLAQKVVILNIFCNTCILFLYVIVGLLIYSYYKACHPSIATANELLPQFVLEVVSPYSGSLGLFAAAVFSAGISTLSASFTAVSSIIINDVWNVYNQKKNLSPLTDEQVSSAMRILPIGLAFVSIFLAFLCSEIHSIILQISFIVFGAGGGPVLGTFIVGLFFPTIKGKSAFFGLIISTIVCFSISIGSALLKVKPVTLRLNQCFNSTLNQENYFDESLIGMVTSTQIFLNMDRIFAVSYQYYSVIAIVINIMISYFSQKLIDFVAVSTDSSKVSFELISPLIFNSLPTLTPSEIE